jgi:hypothetical protein
MSKIVHRPGGGSKFFTLATLAAWMALASPWGLAQLVSSSGLRLGVRAWVAGVLSWLVPPPRLDGGYGVVASVDSATQVTLAAGYSLGSGGSVERWDKSASARLGVVEYSRAAAVVRLSDTTGLAAGDVLYDGTRYTSYTAVAALLTALGSGYDGGIELRNITTGVLIGTWGYNGSAIAPRGPINLAAVSTSQYGTAASAAGTGIVLASAAAWTPALGTLRAWDSTGELGDSAYTRATTTLTVSAALATAVAAAITAGRTVTLWDTATELQIGSVAGGRDVRIHSGLARFNAGLVVENGSVSMLRGGIPSKFWSTSPRYTRTDSAPSDNSYGGSGLWWSTSKFVGIVRQQVTGADTARMATGTLSSPTIAAGAITVAPVGATSGLSLCRNQWNAGTPIINGTIEAATTDGGSAVVDAATYVDPIGTCFLCSGAGANVVTLSVTSC